MAAGTLTEQRIRSRLRLKHVCLGDVRSLSLPGTFEEKIRLLGAALTNFVRLKSLDLSANALVSVDGVQHLKKLERLILYYNRLPSLQEVHVLIHLPALRELDLRRNPLTRAFPDYRPYVLYAMPGLRKLDACPVRATERKAALMPPPPSCSQELVNTLRSSSLRPAPLDHVTRTRTDTADLVLLLHMTSRDQEAAQSRRGEGASPATLDERSSCLLSHLGEAAEEEPQDLTQRTFTPTEGASMVTWPPVKGGKQTWPPVEIISSGSLTVCGDGTEAKLPSSIVTEEKPRVTFDPGVEKHRSEKQKDISRRRARGRLTAGGNDGGSSTDGGSYRKPLELLLDQLDKHWAGERPLHHTYFLSQCVHILSMMETHVSCQEEEVRTLRQEIHALNLQAAEREEERRREVGDLSAQVEVHQHAATKVSEQLTTSLEENVALQKQLVRFQLLKLRNMMKRSATSQIKDAQMDVERLRAEVERLTRAVQEAAGASGPPDPPAPTHPSLSVWT